MLCVRTFIKDHSWIVWIGLMTGGAIVLFQVISLFVMYRYLKLDYYLCLVAICFGAAGWMLNKRRPSIETAVMPADVLVASPASPARLGESLLAVLTSKELLVLH